MHMLHCEIYTNFYSLVDCSRCLQHNITTVMFVIEAASRACKLVIKGQRLKKRIFASGHSV